MVFHRIIPLMMAYYVKRKSQSIELLFRKKWCRSSKMKVPWTTISTYWHCWARRGVRRQGSSSRSLACFWQKCFILLMIGTNGKVHLLSITCIVSFLKFYIPLNLCLLFVAMCLYGDHVITSETLIKSLRQFLATKDREALESALVMILTLMIKMSWTYLHH